MIVVVVVVFAGVQIPSIDRCRRGLFGRFVVLSSRCSLAMREVEATGCGARGMLPVGMEGVYIEPAVGTVPGVGLAVAALPVRNSVCIKLSGSGGSNLGSTGANVEPASLGPDSGCEDDTPCMVVIPGISGGG